MPNRLQIGIKYGELGRGLYPNGVDASLDGALDPSEQVRRTHELIRMGADVIYEAAFAADNGLLFCRVDIFVPRKKLVVEIKASGKINDMHVWDTAFQYHVMAENGLAPKKFILALADNKPQSIDEAHDASEVFSQRSVTRRVTSANYLVSREIYRYKRNLAEHTPPRAKMGSHCRSPYPCPFINACESLKKASRRKQKDQ